MEASSPGSSYKIEPHLLSAMCPSVVGSHLLLKSHSVSKHIILTFLLLNSTEMEGEEERT